MKNIIDSIKLYLSRNPFDIIYTVNRQEGNFMYADNKLLAVNVFVKGKPVFALVDKFANCRPCIVKQPLGFQSYAPVVNISHELTEADWEDLRVNQPWGYKWLKGWRNKPKNALIIVHEACQNKRTYIVVKAEHKLAAEL